MKRGILGGTFDPIHNGHLRLAIEAKEALALDEVVLEVAAASPFKSDRKATDAEIRFRMAALASSDGIVAGRTELERQPPSYTFETVAAYPNDELWVVMGADTLAGFPRWEEPEKILAAARLAAGYRAGASLELILDGLPEEWRPKVDLFHGPLLQISSTDIRRRVGEGLSIRHLVPDSVLQTIEEHRLYR